MYWSIAVAVDLGYQVMTEVWSFKKGLVIAQSALFFLVGLGRSDTAITSTGRTKCSSLF